MGAEQCLITFSSYFNLGRWALHPLCSSTGLVVVAELVALRAELGVLPIKLSMRRGTNRFPATVARDACALE